MLKAMGLLDSVPFAQKDPCISYRKENGSDSGNLDLPVYHTGPYGCWDSWGTSLSTTQSGPYGCWVSWETSLSTTQSGPYGCWVSWKSSSKAKPTGYIINPPLPKVHICD